MQGVLTLTATNIQKPMRFLLLLFLILVHQSLGNADEAVRLKNGITRRGVIERWDDRGIAIRTTTKLETYAAEQIDMVEATLSESHRAGDEGFAAADYRRALSNYKLALNNETRAWAKGRIRQNLVVTLTGLGQWAEAGNEFLTLASERNDAELMRYAPLVWMPETPIPPETIEMARKRLPETKLPMAQLLLASWILESDHKELALPVLRQLQTNVEVRVAWMARAQVWRVRAASASIQEIGEYRELIGRMPLVSRAGPQFVLGLAFESAKQPADAALEYLWIPYVYAERSDLAAAALLRAARASQNAGFKDDSEKLYREVLQTFPRTHWAETAKTRLQLPLKTEANP